MDRWFGGSRARGFKGLEDGRKLVNNGHFVSKKRFAFSAPASSATAGEDALAKFKQTSVAHSAAEPCWHGDIARSDVPLRCD